MNGKKVHLHYDEEGDYLEIYFDKIKPGYFREIKDKYFERIDKKSGKVVGYTIFNFRGRKNKFVDVEILIPKEVLA